MPEPLIIHLQLVPQVINLSQIMRPQLPLLITQQTSHNFSCLCLSLHGLSLPFLFSILCCHILKNWASSWFIYGLLGSGLPCRGYPIGRDRCVWTFCFQALRGKKDTSCPLQRYFQMALNPNLFFTILHSGKLGGDSCHLSCALTPLFHVHFCLSVKEAKYV
jgi:hypothetical protein